MAFSDFISDIQANGWQVHGVEAYENGALAHAWGDTRATRFPVYSVTKAVTSLAVGMAADRKKMRLDACVLRYLPGEAVRAMTPPQREAYRSVTVERLLTMSVPGYPFRPEGDDWLGFSLAAALDHPERPAFEYSNIPAYLAGVAAACALEEDLYSFLNRRLFAPLGIASPPCCRCPAGYFYGASGLELTVNELSRLGLLVYGEGEYRGERIVSADYIRAATSRRQMNRESGYGYFLWVYRDGCSMNGKWGQKCYILPREGKLIAFLAQMENGSDPLRESMERHLLS